MQKMKFVAEKNAPKRENIIRFIFAHPQRFAASGTVVADHFIRSGRRYGPYFRLAYREAHRQKSIYLGTSKALADQVRRLLVQLQKPCRQRRKILQARRAIRASLRKHLAHSPSKRTLGRL